MILFTEVTERGQELIDKINVTLAMYEIKGFSASFKAVKKGSARPYKLIYKSSNRWPHAKQQVSEFGAVMPIRHFETGEQLVAYVQRYVIEPWQKYLEAKP